MNNGNGKDPENDEGGKIVDLAAMRDAMKERLRAQQRVAQAGEPMINLPPVTKFMLFAFIGIHILVAVILSPEQHYMIYQYCGFIPGYYSGAMDAFGPEPYLGPFTYAFLHGGWVHLAMNSVMLMAFGAGIERWTGGRRMFVFFMLCSLVAALAHFVFHSASTDPVIGASGGLSGLFAAAFLMIREQNRAYDGAMQSLWPLVVIWVVISIAFGISGGPGGESIAWQAHIGGFLAGLVLLKPVMRYVP